MWLELVGKLSFIGMALWTVLALVGVAAASITGRPGWTRRLAWNTGAALGLYFVALLGVSLTSHERVIPRGAELPVCGLDCDLFLSVAAVESAPLAAGAHADVLWKVGLRARSDARRVSMSLVGVRVELTDATGRDWTPRVTTGAMLGFEHPLAPGESEMGEYMFQLPAAARSPRLHLAAGPWFTRFVLADEGSMLHARTLLALDPLDHAGASP